MRVEGTKRANVGMTKFKEIVQSTELSSRLATIEGIVFHSLVDASPQFLYKLNPLGQLLPPQGSGPEAGTRGGTLMSPA